MRYGAYKSNRVEENLQLIDELVAAINIVPFTESIEVFAKEKVRLMSQGTPIDDFDLLIGAAAVQQDLILVTDNIKHFKNIQGLAIENWVER